jgi:hypothetical protein
MKRRRKNPQEVNPYDLSEHGGFRRRCPHCGKEKYPNNPNPYDASQWGARQYCHCFD